MRQFYSEEKKMGQFFGLACMHACMWHIMQSEPRMHDGLGPSRSCHVLNLSLACLIPLLTDKHPISFLFCL